MSASAAMPARLWPRPEADPAAPLGLVPVVLGVGVFGALVIRLEALGLAFVVTGAAVLLLAMRLRARRPSALDLATAAAALATLSVVALRGAEWLVPLCVLATWALATVAVVGGRTWTGVAVAATAAVLVPFRALRWFLAPLARLVVPAAVLRRGFAVGYVSVALLLVFGSLFAAADPAYAELVGALVPSWEVPDVAQRLVVLAVVTGVTAMAVYLAQRPPCVDVLAPSAGKPVRRVDWLVPLLLVDLLFASFVLVQLAVLFGGSRHVLETQGLTYAAYARQGFWQLLAVSVLTLVVIAVAVRLAPRTEKRLVQALLGALCVLSLVIVASALHRMGVYEEEYGFTRLRLFVQAVELSLGAVFVLLVVAGATWDARWLPRAVLGVAALGLLGLAAVDPDAWIAEHNVARFETTGRIDVDYLSQLSADAVPALLALPEPQRSCALRPIQARLATSSDPWYDGNLARHRARDLLAEEVLQPCP